MAKPAASATFQVGDRVLAPAVAMVVGDQPVADPPYGPEAPVDLGAARPTAHLGARFDQDRFLALRKVPDLELQIVRDLADRPQPLPDPVAASIGRRARDLWHVVELDRLVAERGEAVRVAGIGAGNRSANDI